MFGLLPMKIPHKGVRKTNFPQKHAFIKLWQFPNIVVYTFGNDMGAKQSQDHKWKQKSLGTSGGQIQNNAEGRQERLRCGGPAQPELSPQLCVIDEVGRGADIVTVRNISGSGSTSWNLSLWGSPQCSVWFTRQLFFFQTQVYQLDGLGSNM